MSEIWKPITEFEGFYEVSNLGKIKSLHKNKETILSPKTNNMGYLWVDLWKNGTHKCLLIHRIVACEFIDNPLNLPIVNHIDRNIKNNRFDNLEWCSYSYNVDYAIIASPNFNRRKRGELKQDQKPVHKRYQQGDLTRKNKKHPEPIVQMDLDGNVIAEYKNIAFATSVLGYHNTSLLECCDGKRKTAYGYIWRYK